MSYNTHTHTHICTADMTERRAAEEDSVVARWRTPILFVQQPVFNHAPPLLPSISLSPLSVIRPFLPLFLAVAVKRFLGLSFLFSPSSSFLSVSVNHCLSLQAHPGCKRLSALSSSSCVPSSSQPVYSTLIKKITTAVSFSLLLPISLSNAMVKLAAHAWFISPRLRLELLLSSMDTNSHKN